MIHQDYIMRMIQQFTDALVNARNEIKLGEESKALATMEDALGHCLNMKGSTVLALAPASLVTVMKLSSLNDAVAIYVSYALERMAEILDHEDASLAQTRREQAQAVARAFEFPLGTVPEGVE